MIDRLLKLEVFFPHQISSRLSEPPTLEACAGVGGKSGRRVVRKGWNGVALVVWPRMEILVRAVGEKGMRRRGKVRAGRE